MIQFIDYDDDENLPNLTEELYEEITRDTGSAIHLQPNVQERKKLKKITLKSSIEPLTMQEKNTIWKFRYTLLKENTSLSKFLKSVNWQQADQTKEA